MKKFLFAVIALCTIGLYTAEAQQGVYMAQAPKVTTGGKINATTLGNGSATATSATAIPWTSFPLYSKIDTVTNTGLDTINQKLTGEYNSVYTWCHVNSISGTNTSCTVTLEASGDAGSGLDWTALQTYTVTATGNPYKHLVNAGIGNPYTNYRWRFVGVGTQSSSWYVGLEVR